MNFSFFASETELDLLFQRFDKSEEGKVTFSKVTYFV